jgi:hypothetical protein
MIIKLKIYCEGITDQVFISDFIQVNYGFEMQREITSKKKLIIDAKTGTFDLEIIDVGGCTKLSDALYVNQLIDSTDEGYQNLVIFDADYKGIVNGNKGYASCKQKLDNIITSKEISFDYFIWPNNNDDGEIETLLNDLIPDNKQNIFNCIDSHQSCLASLGHDNLKVADLKDKIGYYLYTCNQNSNVGKRDYKNSKYWELSAPQNSSLNEFKKFLDNYCQI